MQNTWSWKPAREYREVPIPRYSALAAAAENEPLQSPHSLPEDTQPVNYSFNRPQRPMALLVEGLEQQLSAAVKDNTGLTRNFDFVLHWAQDDSLSNAKYPAIPSALQEQFGLRLKAETGPVDHYVITRAEHPSPN